jgi:hypothetical protein
LSLDILLVYGQLKTMTFSRRHHLLLDIRFVVIPKPPDWFVVISKPPNEFVVILKPPI